MTKKAEKEIREIADMLHKVGQRKLAARLLALAGAKGAR